MRFQPMSEKEALEQNLLQPGTYDFEVISAEDKQSESSGNDMIALKLRIFTDTGEKTVFDYLVFTEKNQFKIRRFCETTGMLSRYESGELAAEDCENRCGKAVLGIQKDKTGQYPDRNTVKEYCKPGEPTAKATTEANASFDADNIPF